MATSKALISHAGTAAATPGVAPLLNAALRLARKSQRASALAPAAIRVERNRMRSASGKADQTALTVWFRTAPALPAPGLAGSSSRAVLRVAAGALVAAALGAMAALAAHREALGVDQEQRKLITR